MYRHHFENKLYLIQATEDSSKLKHKVTGNDTLSEAATCTRPDSASRELTLFARKSKCFNELSPLRLSTKFHHNKSRKKLKEEEDAIISRSYYNHLTSEFY